MEKAVSFTVDAPPRIAWSITLVAKPAREPGSTRTVTLSEDSRLVLTIIGAFPRGLQAFHSLGSVRYW